LLSKDDWRAALGDERKPARPQVALVIGRLPFAGGREGLAGAGACPNRSVIRESGESEGERPARNACKKMALGVSPEIVGPYVKNTSLVHIAGGNVSGGNEIAEPLCGIWIDLVVVGSRHHPHHGQNSMASAIATTAASIGHTTVRKSPAMVGPHCMAVSLYE
jgi:hypothetical protein